MRWLRRRQRAQALRQARAGASVWDGCIALRQRRCRQVRQPCTKEPRWCLQSGRPTGQLLPERQSRWAGMVSASSHLTKSLFLSAAHSNHDEDSIRYASRKTYLWNYSGSGRSCISSSSSNSCDPVSGVAGKALSSHFKSRANYGGDFLLVGSCVVNTFAGRGGNAFRVDLHDAHAGFNELAKMPVGVVDDLLRA